MEHLPTPTTASSDISSLPGTAAVDPAVLRKELDQAQSAYVRLAADFANLKRRATEEAERRADARKEAFIRELLPVLDNLERALKQLRHLLRRHGIEVERPAGQRFDPHRHEAVAVRHDPSQPEHIVLQVTQRGYLRGSQVLRPAKVVVNDLSQTECHA